jgi:serine/threonine protein kinase/tetratricopeptide (TPR) repeat protein
MECPECHSNNPPTAVRCGKCDTPFDLQGATLVATPPPTPPAARPSTSRPPTSPSSTPASTPGAPDISDPDATMAAGVTTDPAKGWSIPAQTPIRAAAQVLASSLTAGTVLGRYEIIQLLGQGGMGAVYKARDTELERLVALKVIRPELAIHPDILQRFKQELILARKVTHKNVIRIFDLGEAEGIKFITMDFIDGQDLKGLVTEKGRLTPQEIVPIMEQVCLALEAAHAEGVVHRDLKPQNIMIDKQGRVAVMDFGIARSMEGGSTQTGALMGTPEYMSPEQVMGEHVDQRSDLFTLGVIFYELLVGSMPYKADTVQAAMFKRTRERPKSPIEVDATVPKPLSDITAKCLEMDPANRYQTAAEIREDLEAFRGGTPRAVRTVEIHVPVARPAWHLWSAIGAGVVVLILAGLLVRDKFLSSGGNPTPGQAPAISLAILPFHNASEDKSIDWLGSSMAEMLGTDVGQSSRVRTISSERISQILRDLKISPEVALDLPTVQRLAEFSNADTVIWGQYAKFGDQIRIDATVQDLKHNHATSVKVQANGEKDVLPAVDKLAAEIRDNLAVSHSIAKELASKSFKPSSNSLDALRSYNQGLQLERQGNNLEAAKSFEAATQTDPQFALAFSELAESRANLGQESEADQASRRAVELSANLPEQEKLLIVASHQRILKDYPKAIAAYQDLVKSSPDNADLLFTLGGLYETTGAYDKAGEAYSNVLKLDPKRPDGLLAMGRVKIQSGDPQASLNFLNQAQTMAVQLGDDEVKADILQATGVAYSVLNKLDDALKSFQASLEIKQRLGLKKGIADSLESIAQCEAALGKPDAALKDYNQSLQIRRDTGDKAGEGDVLNDLAQFYDDHGKFDDALKLFKQALQVQVDMGNASNQGLVLNNIGNTYLLKGDFEDARTYFQQALQLRQDLKMPNDIADTMHNLGEVSVAMGNYEQALDQYMKVLDLRRGSGDKRGAALEASSIGELFDYQGRYGAALSSEEDALKTMRDLHDQTASMVDVLKTYGAALAEAGRYADAKKALDEAMTLAHNLNNQAEVVQIEGFQGDNALYSGDTKAAETFYQQAAQGAPATANHQLVLLSKINLAKLAVMQGRYQIAATALKPLSEEADTEGLRYLSVECSVYLAKALTEMKNYKAAQQETERALARSEKLGLRSLLAQSHFLLARDLEAGPNKAEATGHYQQAKQIVNDMKKESGTGNLATRSDLKPIFDHAA